MAVNYYTTREVADLLGVSIDAVRMRAKRGAYEVFKYNGQSVGVLKKPFWAVCAKREQNGQIRLKDMPERYKEERVKFLGDRSYEDCVLRGRADT